MTQGLVKVSMDTFQYRVQPPPDALSPADVEKYRNLEELSNLIEQSKKVWYKSSPKNQTCQRLRRVGLEISKTWHHLHVHAELGSTSPLHFSVEELDACFRPSEDPEYNLDWDQLRTRARELYDAICK